MHTYNERLYLRVCIPVSIYQNMACSLISFSNLFYMRTVKPYIPYDLVPFSGDLPMLQWSLRVQQLMHSRHSRISDGDRSGNGVSNYSCSSSASTSGGSELRCPAWIQEADIPLREVVFQLPITAATSVDNVDLTLKVLEAALEERSRLHRGSNKSGSKSATNRPHYSEGPYFATNDATQLLNLIVEVRCCCCSFCKSIPITDPYVYAVRFSSKTFEGFAFAVRKQH
jgi:hypothetical protein